MGTKWLWKHISDEWFYTRSAVWVFSISATLVVLCTVFGGSLEFVPNSVQLFLTKEASNPSLMVQLGFALVAIPLVIAYLVVLVGMFRFWVVCDHSSRMARRIWFVVMIVGMLFGFSLGTALYCFAVYLPQVLKNSSGQSQRVAV